MRPERDYAQLARGGPADGELVLNGGQGDGLDLDFLAGRGGVEQQVGSAALGALAGGEAGVVLGFLGGGLDAGDLLAELDGAQLHLGGRVLGLGLLETAVGALGGSALRLLLAELRLGGVAASGGDLRRLHRVGLGAGLALRRRLLELRPRLRGLRLCLGGGGGRLRGGRAGTGGHLVLRLGDVGLVGQGRDPFLLGTLPLALRLLPWRSAASRSRFDGRASAS
ncbi:hypothetical protein ACIBCU_37710 [Streptomyces sp. NPDC051064]|uniref:hypothetical protein n=1 Tax=Streptomyces sp. NPDC051064 TaxID=3365641 RepID=UPI00379803E9